MGFDKTQNSAFKNLNLNTKKITIISLLLAVCTLISLFEIPTFFSSFLTLDFSSTVLLISLFLIGLVYSLLIACIFPWLRLIIPHTVASNAVGELSNMLSSISLLLIYYLVFKLFLVLFKNNSNPQARFSATKKVFWYFIITAIITCLAISLINVFFNWAFILSLYNAGQFKKMLWPVLFPYNLFKFSLVLLVFLLLLKPVYNLKLFINL